MKYYTVTGRQIIHLSDLTNVMYCNIIIVGTRPALVIQRVLLYTRRPRTHWGCKNGLVLHVILKCHNTET